MKAVYLLPPQNRSIRDRLFQFLRLLRRRMRYNRNCPTSLPTHQRLRLHFTYLQLYWGKITEFQQAVGLEAAYFCPREQFELIVLVTRMAEREMKHTALPLGKIMDNWKDYLAALNSLSYDINPYEFSERCSRCHNLLEEINNPASADGTPIKMDTAHFFRLAGASPGPKLKVVGID